MAGKAPWALLEGPRTRQRTKSAIERRHSPVMGLCLYLLNSKRKLLLNRLTWLFLDRLA